MKKQGHWSLDWADCCAIFRQMFVYDDAVLCVQKELTLSRQSLTVKESCHHSESLRALQGGCQVNTTCSHFTKMWCSQIYSVYVFVHFLHSWRNPGRQQDGAPVAWWTDTQSWPLTPSFWGFDSLLDRCDCRTVDVQANKEQSATLLCLMPIRKPLTWHEWWTCYLVPKQQTVTDLHQSADRLRAIGRETFISTLISAQTQEFVLSPLRLWAMEAESCSEDKERWTWADKPPKQVLGESHVSEETGFPHHNVTFLTLPVCFILYLNAKTIDYYQNMQDSE